MTANAIIGVISNIVERFDNTNTYGLRSINDFTFNLHRRDNTHEYPKNLRDSVVTLFRIHNCVLDILGYIPRTSKVSGSVRMLTGFCVFLAPIVAGKKEVKDGESAFITGPWYSECLRTGGWQVLRGALEAYVSYGKVINVCIGFFATIQNFLSNQRQHKNSDEPDTTTTTKPHKDPDYPFILGFLNFV